MKNIIYISFVLLILIQCQKNNGILENGKYKMEFTGEFAVVSGNEIEVRDNVIVEMESNMKKAYKSIGH